MRFTYDTSLARVFGSPLEEISVEELQRSHDRARRVQVVENKLTIDFIVTRDEPHWSSNDLWFWRQYKSTQRKRNRMGEYCRSALDWDIHTSNSLKSLFAIDSPRTPPEHSTSPGISAFPGAVTNSSETNEGISDVTILKKVPRPLKKVVRIKYETEEGEVKYMMFHAVPSVENGASDPDPRMEPEQLCEEGYVAGEPQSPAYSRRRTLMLMEGIGSSTEASYEAGQELELGVRDVIQDSVDVDQVHEEMFRKHSTSTAEGVNYSTNTMDRPQYGSEPGKVGAKISELDHVSMCSLD